ncbi:tRNA A64-2'-O-ribosylphosphate transferase [Cytidiella melzeri]|nr:tRNA A64-2'-O-ribosylphosphate transferase [Cytidiella melzeri]
MTLHRTAESYHAQALAELRKESLDIYNRLHSIAEDVEFVDSVRNHYKDLPIVPNLRCGAWYVNPSTALQQPAYFKSTDGHFNNWSFNLRRPNIHLLGTVNHHRGLILVDSTRAGKRMPDALSKTVPLWCAVINRAVKIRYTKGNDWDTSLYTPPGVVSAQEHSQIETRLQGWAAELHHSDYELPDLKHPLRPLWITPASASWPHMGSADERSFCSVICVSASRQVHEGLERRTNGFAYVQGSGDDHELWGQGLTPSLFWTHHHRLLRSERSLLESVVAELVRTLSAQADHISYLPTLVDRVSGRIMIGIVSEFDAYHNIELSSPRSTAYVVISEQLRPHIAAPEETESNTVDAILTLDLPAGKRGQSKLIEVILPQSLRFIDARLARGDNICICCDTGKDASVGVALAALQLFFDEFGTYVPVDERQSMSTPDKRVISKRLQWIITSRPQANPSRATLKRVNEFLMTPAAFRRKEASQREPVLGVVASKLSIRA